MNKKNIAIIDYGMSNMFSMKNALDRLGFHSTISSDPALLDSVDGAVLPGVGSFPEAANKLNSLGLGEAIEKYVISGRPFLGVCLGFQLLFDHSTEFGIHPGLGILKGGVSALADTVGQQRVPHVGWNRAEVVQSNSGAAQLNPMAGIGSDEHFYFVHSYYAAPVGEEDIYTKTRYGEFEFCSSVLRNNIFACQFHPEKSGEAGIQLLSNIFSD